VRRTVNNVATVHTTVLLFDASESHNHSHKVFFDIYHLTTSSRAEQLTTTMAYSFLVIY